MPFIVPQDVQEQLVNPMATGRYRSSDEVLRSAMQALAHADEDLVAVQEALIAWHEGDEGIVLDEAFRMIRASRRESPRE